MTAFQLNSQRMQYLRGSFGRIMTANDRQLSAEDGWLILSCRSCAVEIRGLLISVEQALSSQCVEKTLSTDVTLVLAEVMTNVARHGYGHDQGLIECRIALSADCIRCDLRDQGCEFDPDTLGRSLPDPASLSEGGYGWFMIHHLTRDFRYTRQNGTNRVQFTVCGTEGR